jgi:hypothetical protein
MDIPAKPNAIRPIASKTTFHSMEANLLHRIKTECLIARKCGEYFVFYVDITVDYEA